MFDMLFPNMCQKVLNYLLSESRHILRGSKEIFEERLFETKKLSIKVIIFESKRSLLAQLSSLSLKMFESQRMFSCMCQKI